MLLFLDLIRGKTGPELTPFLESLANNAKLKHLDISHNKIGDRVSASSSASITVLHLLYK
jgi:hypothetical protein